MATAKRDAATTTKATGKAVALLAGAALLAASIAACGDGAVDALDMAGPLPAPTQTVRSIVDAGPAMDAGNGKSAAQNAFEALLPDLSRACGGACHEQGKGNAPAWIGPPDPYKSITTYKGIVVKDVATSTILSKGRHEGPDLVDPLRGQVQAWLGLEAARLASQELATTDLFAVTMGANTVDLSKATTGSLAGGVSLTFNASQSGDILTLSNIKVVAPASSGVHVVFPIFVVNTVTGEEREDTSFSNADQTFAAGQAGTLSPGMLILTGWTATDRMRIEFTKLEGASAGAMDGGAEGGTTGGGCKSVGSFTSNAVPAIQQNGCLNCHNSGGSGNGALDLSALAANDDATACAQARLRIDTANPAQSDIILAPTGGVANHPFKNAGQSYAQMMEAWIANEK